MKILIIDDEQNILKTTSVALKSMGHVPHTASNGSQAIRLCNEERFDVVFLDLKLGQENGLEVLDQLIPGGHDFLIIVFTAYSTVESAVEAMRKGAYDYIQKPFLPEEIRQVLKKVEEDRKLHSKLEALESQLAEENPAISLQSSDPATQAVYDMAVKAAASDASMLVLGPSGTGKTVLARNIHAISPRASEPFVTVHCPSLSKELLESELFGHTKGSFTGAVKETWGKVAKADGGTLFLDEIGDIPPDIQAKLLRLLQDQEFERVGETRTHSANVRIIAATNADILKRVKENTFRDDLYYRLNVFTLKLPPLHERPGDILPMAEKYLNFYAQKMHKPTATLSEDARAAFAVYSWEGNLRELRNVIERALILCNGNEIKLQDLPEQFQQHCETSSIRPGMKVTLKELENDHIRRVLDNTESLEESAQILGIDTATLYRKRKKLGLLND